LFRQAKAGRIMNSDSFRTELQQRRAELCHLLDSIKAAREIQVSGLMESVIDVLTAELTEIEYRLRELGDSVKPYY